MAVILETARQQEWAHEPQRKEELFPGVPWHRIHIAPVGDAPPPLTDDQAALLSYVTQTVNERLARSALFLNTGETNRFFTLLETDETAAAHMTGLAHAVREQTMDAPDAHLVFFPAGGLELAKQIRGTETKAFPMRRMHVVDVSGTIGTRTGESRVRTVFSDDLLDPNTSVYCPDDIEDSSVTLFRLIAARSIARDPSAHNEARLADLLVRIQHAHTANNTGLDAYQDLVGTAAAEKVIFAPIWSKNRQLRTAIEQAVFTTRFPHPDWQRQQGALLRLYRPPVYNPRAWLIGGGVTDTGVPVSRFANGHTALRQFIGPVVNGNANEWLIRAGVIPQLAYLNPNHDHEQHLIEEIGRVANLMVK